MPPGEQASPNETRSPDARGTTNSLTVWPADGKRCPANSTKAGQGRPPVRNRQRRPISDRVWRKRLNRARLRAGEGDLAPFPGGQTQT